MAARKFDRPTTGNLDRPDQIVRYFDKFLTSLESELGALTEAQAAMAQALDAEHHADWSGVNNDDGHKPENDATVSDNLVHNWQLADTTRDMWWGTMTRTAGGNGDPQDYADSLTTGQGGSINSGAQIPVVAGGTLFVSALCRRPTGTSATFRVAFSFYKATGVLASTVNADLVPTSTAWTLIKNTVSVPSTAAYALIAVSSVLTASSIDVSLLRIARTEYQATLGADWSANLTSRPTELTDGRITTALNSSGVLLTNISTTIATASNLLRKTGGGLYSGDLNATFGADLASNVTNNNTTNLTDGAGLGNTAVVLDPVATVIIYADSTGAVKTGELTRTVNLSASRGNTSVTTSGTWTRTIASGVTCTIGAATGVLSITALSSPETYVPVSFTYSGVTRTVSVHILRQDDPPTNTGSSGASGSSSSTTTLGNTTGTSYDTVNAVSAVIMSAAGAGGQVECVAPVGFKSVDGVSFIVPLGKWQWLNGATWTDIATEVTGTQNDYDSGSQTCGSLTVDQTKTGLTSGTTYNFRFLWRDNGARARRVSGTLVATGS